MMDRAQIVNAALWPADAFLGAFVEGLEKVGIFGRASDLVSKGLQRALLANFRLNNELEVSGDENVPLEGGVLLASNHQSWLDVQVLGAACPRRPHFIAKAEFTGWPALRHLIRISESVYIRRGGDNAALGAVAEALRGGWAVAIYPEGTIPGEEEIPRVAVDPRTGLLPGKTGAARLAMMANVPVVPVGVSGTGRAFPPEVYPRLEVLRLPRNTPIRIAFGRPIPPDEYLAMSDQRQAARDYTERVMGEISKLVDHRSNYVPIEVPIPECPSYESVGVLLLHGFTSHTNTVSGLVPLLQKAGLDYELPTLRGHGTRYQDLTGVSAKDWYVDAQRALINLWNRVDRVVVVGLSMGGLLALELAMNHPDKIAGVVSVGAALKFADPMAKLTPVLSRLVKYWPSPDPFNDPECRAKSSRNYPKFPTAAFGELYRYSQWVADNLGDVHVPLRIMQSKKDQIVAPESANIIYEKVSTPRREIYWYEESGHEMLLDCEAEQVMNDVVEFARRFHRQRPVDLAPATKAASS